MCRAAAPHMCGAGPGRMRAGQTRINKLHSMTTSQIESVAVVGGGFMGTGSRSRLPCRGMRVVVRDVDEAALERAQG